MASLYREMLQQPIRNAWLPILFPCVAGASVPVYNGSPDDDVLKGAGRLPVPASEPAWKREAGVFAIGAGSPRRFVIQGVLLGALAVVISFFPAAAEAKAEKAGRGGDIALGKYLSAECVSCHQLSGASMGGVPNIGGLDETVFAAALRDYKTGKRANAVMRNIAAGLSDEEIAALAA